MGKRWEVRGWDGEGDWEEKEGERGNYSWYVKLINYKKDYNWVFFLLSSLTLGQELNTLLLRTLTTIVCFAKLP